MNDRHDRLTRLMAERNPVPLAAVADRVIDPEARALLERILATPRARSGVRQRTVGVAGRPVAGSRRLVPRHPVAGAMVALLAAGILVLAGLTPGGRPLGASAEATTLLSRAAVNATDPVVGPRQYLLVTERGVFQGGVCHIQDGSRGGRYITVRRSGLTKTWIPGDPSKPWVRRGTNEPDRFMSPEDARAARAGGCGGTEPSSELERAHDGEWHDRHGPRAPSWQTPTPAFLAGLPHDPRALLERIYRDSRGQGPSRQGEALVFIADVLRAGAGIVPADLRAALFKAATRIPGVQVIDKRANLDGRTGVSVGRYEPKTRMRQELIFDPETGQVIGEREVNLNRRSAPGDPAVVWPDHITSWTSVQVTVVDQAP
jgi:hypothetical protein